APSTRGYASAAGTPAGGSAGLAPYFLGAGLAGSALFYYSTRDQRALKTESAANSSSGAKKSSTPALSPDEFRNLTLTEVKPYNDNTSRFVFDLPEGTSSGLTVASALVVKAAKEGECLNDKGKPVIRPYTPVTAPDLEGKLELLIKHYPNGAFTEYLWKLKPGDAIAFKGPIPKHPWKANEFESVAMIAGGSGITPMWQVLQAIDANPEDKTKATLIFSNVQEKDILLRKEFEELASRKPDQFKIVFTLDQPPSGWKGPQGYVNPSVVRDALKEFGTTPDKGDKIKIFVCGPPGQVKAISGPKKSMKDQGELTGVLAELDYKKEQVFKF
ncbi:hypothetical protein JCM10908_001146, partial [Rhodotorula pacifica]|uniref:cytochrome b5 reductase family protein n=1 Tax=Rhodotorula pacifica TaxID=1495444 RepID=UPI00317AB066